MNKKIIVITGKPESGKTSLAKNMALAFENPIWLDARSFSLQNRFFFDCLNKSHDLIVLDDLPQRFVNFIAYGLSTEITIEKRGQKPFEIPTPKIIITCDVAIKTETTDQSFLRRVKEINVSNLKPLIITTTNDLISSAV